MKAHDNNFPTPEQKAVIDSTSHITVVRACPGSGKTRVFVEYLRTRLDSWTKKNAGIAAISFTNVAQEQVAKGIGKNLPYPHFIGTLDSFVYRYIVRPFGHLVGLPKEGARLIPAPLDDAIEHPKVEIDANHTEVSLFGIRFVDGSIHKPNIKAKTNYGQVDIDPNYVSAILNKKRNEWRKRGRITHSDCQYISSLILCNQEFGHNVSKLVTRRFPMILIDEFQDTNWFLGRTLVELLRSPFLESGLVVGDPDQAIFEFGGADPNLFNYIDNLPNAKSLTLNQTHRCPKKIAYIASELSDTGKQILSREDADQGVAIILVHNMDKMDYNIEIVKNITKFCGENDHLAIISRRGLTIKKFLGESNKNAFKGISHAGKNIDYAMQMFCSNQSRIASRIMERELAWILFENDSPSTRDIHDTGIDLFTWRRIIYQILKEGIRDVEGETWNDWLARIRGVVQDSAMSLNCEFDKRRISNNLKRSAKGDVIRKKLDNEDEENNLIKNATIKTIHQVKGDEFECVAILVPKPDTNSPCPSSEWWPTCPSEERRVAFVAVSRAKKTLILCIHHDTYDALRTLRPNFVGLFKEIIPFKRQKSLMDFS